MSRRTFFATSAVLLGITLLIDVSYVIRCSDGLSPWGIGNPYSEANVLRAAQRYADEGYAVDWGLPCITYGDRFPGEGQLPLVGAGGMARPVYHGYPCGSEWVAGLHAKLLGTEHVTPFRIFPVALRLLACSAFLAGLARAFGPGRALAVYLACLLVPMFTTFTQGLHAEGYTVTLLLFQLALVMGTMSRAGPGTMAALLLLGFLQGWVSWDYCFVVAFAPVPMALLTTPAGSPIPWRNVLAQCVAAGAGFTAAHILHFTESALYLGGVGAAIEKYRRHASLEYAVKEVLEGRSLPGRWMVGLGRYRDAYIGTEFFARAGRLAVYGVVAILVLRRAEFQVGRWRIDARFARPGAREIAAIAIALALGLAWLFAKPYHAVNHYFMTIRHVFLFYLACCLVIARATEVFLARGPVRDDPRGAIPAERAGRDIEPDRAGRGTPGFPTPVNRPSEAAQP